MDILQHAKIGRWKKFGGPNVLFQDRGTGRSDVSHLHVPPVTAGGLLPIAVLGVVTHNSTPYRTAKTATDLHQHCVSAQTSELHFYQMHNLRTTIACYACY